MSDNIINLHDQAPHETAELICVACKGRWHGVYAVSSPLKAMSCPICNEYGTVIKTGQTT